MSYIEKKMFISMVYFKKYHYILVGLSFGCYTQSSIKCEVDYEHVITLNILAFLNKITLYNV